MRGWIWPQMTLCVLLALSAAGCSCAGITRYAFDASDLVGTWRADYAGCFEKRCWYLMTGFETLMLRPDGTYQQIYDDGKGYVYTSPWAKWYVEDRKGSAVLHLEGGRFYPLGIGFAEALADGSWYYRSDDDGRGYPLHLDGTEVILHVRTRSAERSLDYPPVCDPDVPVIVKFYLVATPAPTYAATLTLSP